MKVTIPYEYTEKIIPKRCRKIRPAKFNSIISVSIHEVSSMDAPIAILEHTKKFSNETNKYEPITIEYRWWNKKLWVLDKLNRFVGDTDKTQTAKEFTVDPYPMTNGTQYYTAYRTKQEQRKSIMNWASTILFIDGMRWTLAGEPRYVIMTFGLGHNHAGIGTSLSNDNHYNTNITNTRYFRIDQYQQALETAIKIALNRGDTDSIPYIRNESTAFSILIPESIRLNPHKEHGKGDAFINKIEGIIETLPCAELAGLALIANLKQEIEIRK
jgi:hypothetical protein